MFTSNIMHLFIYNKHIDICTYLKFENHLTSCAVLFLLNLMSGKYILRIAEDGYLVQKNISFAFLKCIGVNVELCKSEREYPKMKQQHKI